MKKSRIATLVVLIVSFLTTGLGCKGLTPEQQAALKPITLEYWSVFEDPAAMRELITKYNARYPQIKINFRRMRYEEYEKELLNAMAEDRAPDIVSIQNTWVRGYVPKLAEQPAGVTVPRVTYKSSGGGIAGDAQPQIENVTFDPTPLYTVRRFKDTFVAAAGEDAVIKDEKGVEKIYGYPLSMDTLQLFYNRELLDKAGVAEPPKTWEEFNNSIEKLRKIDTGTNKIVQAAAALGRADNVERAADIVMLLMAQNGARLKDDSGRPAFDIVPADLKNRTKAPGPEALAFYTDFANPAKSDVYTWNKDLPNSVDMFARGTLAYFFGYSYHRDQILERAPKLNYGVAPVPQLNATPVHMANYWVQSVTKKSRHKDEAWHFVNFITQEQQAATYLKKVTRPTALRSLVKKQLEDESLEVIRPFIQGVLTAKGWYQGSDAKTAEQIISSMIRRVNDNAFEPGIGDVFVVAVRDAVHQLNTTR